MPPKKRSGKGKGKGAGPEGPEAQHLAPPPGAPAAPPPLRPGPPGSGAGRGGPSSSGGPLAGPPGAWPALPVQAPPGGGSSAGTLPQGGPRPRPSMPAAGQSSGSGTVSAPAASSRTMGTSTSSPSFGMTSLPSTGEGSSSSSQESLQAVTALAGLQLVPKELQLGGLPRRPDKGGTAGRRLDIKVNHFKALVKANTDIYHYDVAISPEVSSRGVNRLVINEVVRQYKNPRGNGPHLAGRLPAYDGRKNLYVAGILPGGEQGPPIVFEDITLPDEGESTRRQRKFTVTLKFASKLDLNLLRQYLAGRYSDIPQDVINAVDIVLREMPVNTKNYIAVGRSFYSETFDRPFSLTGGVDALKGFFQTMRPSQLGIGQPDHLPEIHGLTLNLDMSASAFLKPAWGPDFVKEFLQKRDIGQAISDSERLKLRKVLRGVRVQVRHQPHKRRYKVTGITEKPMKDLRFDERDEETGRTKSVRLVDYFLQKYQWRLQFVNLPCLDCGKPDKPNWLPFEVCDIMERQRYVRKLTGQQTSNMLTAAKQTPEERERRIKQLVAERNFAADPYAKEFGIQINPEMLILQARVLDPPRLRYGDGKETVPRTGSWNMRDIKVVDGARAERWTCINFAAGGGRDSVPDDIARAFCKQLAQMCSKMGMAVNPELCLPLISCRPFMPDVEQALRYVSEQANKLRPRPNKPPLDFILCMLPTINTIYGDIKRISELETGQVTQCCLAKNIPKMNLQYLANLALNINPKIGGRNVFLSASLSRALPIVNQEPTILFGADVTHPSPGEDSSPSIAAVVATMDWPQMCNYFGMVRAQPSRQEIIGDLFRETRLDKQGIQRPGMITEALTMYRLRNKHLPTRLIFYRDGVSEGQFDQVRDMEVYAIRKACQALAPGYVPKVTFIVVQKRHHTRMFPKSRDQADGSGNVLPGTVVDTHICQPNQYDFFLCSHAGIQGVSKPAKYVVLWDENRFGSDDLQSLTNSLCYTYAGCTRSVSVAPPAYYAHKLAFRARLYLAADQSDSGSQRGASRSQAGVSAGGVSSASRSSRDVEDSIFVQALPDLKENVKNVMFYT